MTDKAQRKGSQSAGSGGPHARLDRDVQVKIGEGLRAMYDDVVRQGVPDRFAELLAKLDEQGKEDDSRQT